MMNKFLSIVVVFSFSFMNLETAKAQQNTPEILVQKTFAKDIAEKTSNNLKATLKPLEAAFNRKDSPYNRYWLSYAIYYQAILANLQNRKEEAEMHIDRAIALLIPIKNDAESLALLSLQQGYSTQFKGYFALMQIGKQAMVNAKRAVAINPKSLRANLALAINDFYTPKLFGGGELAPFYLKKALEVSEINPIDSLPNWGKDQVYELLVKHYRKIDQDNIAQEYLNQGIAEFPESELLSDLN